MTALCGSTVTANVFVVGMAIQAGGLPIGPASIEAAIELNGVAVEQNLAAFRWGRAMIVDPAGVTEAAAAASDTGTADVQAPLAAAEPAPATVPPRLDARIREIADASNSAVTPQDHDNLPAALHAYVAELCAYQSERLAGEFLDAVERTARADRDAGDGSARLTTAVAGGLFKLMAYKDEYEVARLMGDPAATAAARQLAASVGGVVSWKLHPPLLRALGRTGKIGFSTAWRPVFALLARGKRLRGRWCDPFGHTEVRRTERALVGEYLAAVDAAVQALERDAGAGRYELAVGIGRLPELVRGYEDIKMAAVEKFRAELDERVAELELSD